ncbi:MAG TPA: flagellar hook-associated protein FlgL [Clostridiales bacterium]|nr:flagellar hook-associated protein FlgL [Clostridiales bacterium]
MRITNKMMTNNMLSNINSNKNSVANLEEQYTSGKKIQKPSDDPVIAVRALKLRSNLSELKQYLEKNIPDARSWMEMTEGSLKTVNEILSKINTSCIQGSSDTLTAKDRAAIVQNLHEMKEQIYQEGNSNLAGRYIFSGYKTDSSLTFEEKTSNLEYTITEEFKSDQIKTSQSVYGEYGMQDLYDMTKDFTISPKTLDSYRLKLSYEKLEDNPTVNIDSITQTIQNISVTDPEAYNPAPDEINFIKETGELVFGKDVYDSSNDKSIEVIYNKNSFEKGELKPEHYFTCNVQDNIKNTDVEFIKSKQSIQYEVNFNQRLTINVEGSDAIKHQIGIEIDEILNRVNDVISTENKIEEIKKKLEDRNLTEEEKAKAEQILDHFNTELILRKDTMQRSFEKGMTGSSKQQDIINTAVSDIGSRMVRLNLTESRLSDQKVEFTELMSINEDVDLIETYIKFNAAQNIYMASLSATAKSIKNTLLDFL